MSSTQENVPINSELVMACGLQFLGLDSKIPDLKDTYGMSKSSVKRVINMFLAVGTLKDGYIRNVPLPRVQRIQSASNYTKTTQSQVDAYEYASGKGNSLPDYLPVSSWIPRLPKLGRLIRFSQEIL